MKTFQTIKYKTRNFYRYKLSIFRNIIHKIRIIIMVLRIIYKINKYKKLNNKNLSFENAKKIISTLSILSKNIKKEQERERYKKSLYDIEKQIETLKNSYLAIKYYKEKS